MNSGKEIIVIGGGVIGLACAHYLLETGARVRVIDKDAIGSGASHGNCGLLYFSDVKPLCAPGAVSHELMRTIKGTSPLYIKPEINLRRWRWLMNFALKCRGSQYLDTAKKKYEILTYSQALFDTLLSIEELACDLEKNGVVIAFRDRQNFKNYQNTANLLAEFNINTRAVEKEGIKGLEPALAHQDLAGAWHLVTDWILRPDMLMASWRRHLNKKGVIMEEYSKVLEFDVRGETIVGVNTVRGRFEADAFVLATGAWSPDIMRQLDLDIPVEPGKGYSITMERPGICPSHACYFYEKNVVATPWKSGYRLGGTMEFSGFSHTLNPNRLKKLVTAAGLYLMEPCGHPVLEQWTGLRPMTFDDMPIIDRVPAFDNLTVATGHGMLGLTLATGTGKMISDLVSGRTPEIDMKPYSLARFA